MLNLTDDAVGIILKNSSFACIRGQLDCPIPDDQQEYSWNSDYGGYVPDLKDAFYVWLTDSVIQIYSCQVLMPCIV